MIERENSLNGWSYDHPLFQFGIFSLPVKGYYSPVTDSIILLDSGDDVWRHEATHRIFSVFDAGSYALRRLAGISHSLLSALVHNINVQNLHVTGNSLDSLQTVHLHADDNPFYNILSALIETERLFDRCYWNMVPVAEIAAIDFQPGDKNNEWFPERVEDSDESRYRKEQQIRAVAARLAQIKTIPHHNIQKELLDTWRAYAMIDGFFYRYTLLQLAISALIRSGEATSNPHRLFSSDTLSFMRDHIPEAREIKVIKQFHIERFRLFRKTRSVLQDFTHKILDDLSRQFHDPVQITTTLGILIAESHPSANYEFPKTDPDYERMGNPYYGLLNFSIDPTGRRRVLLNSGYEFILKQQSIPEMPFVKKDWWRTLTLYETLRQALKMKRPVVCPFRDWEGVNCDEECPIRKTIAQLQERTEIAVEGGACLN